MGLAAIWSSGLYPAMERTRPTAEDRCSSHRGWSACMSLAICSLFSSRNLVSSSIGSSTGTWICSCGSGMSAPTVMVLELLLLQTGEVEPQDDESSCSISDAVLQSDGMLYKSRWPNKGTYLRSCLKNWVLLTTWSISHCLYGELTQSG